MRCLLLCLLPTFACTSVQAASPKRVTDVVRAYRDAHAAEIVQDFSDLLSHPNVAADSAGIARNVEALVARLNKRGFTVTPWREGDAPPLVYAERKRRGVKRTVAIYIHYDGQPVDRSRWVNDPWEPTLYDGVLGDGAKAIPLPAAGQPVDPDWRLYARSAGDDKAPVISLTRALDALDGARIPLTWNVKLLLDGEEEAGSPHLERYLDAHREELADVDLWLFCDGPTHQSGAPQVVFGVRGVTGMEVTVYGATRELHSGHYGNFAPVPGNLMAHLLASMKGIDGEVLVKGFYDTHLPVSDADREALATAPAIDAQLRSELGLRRSEVNDAPYGEQLLKPALTIRGVASGNVGEKARNAIPERAVAALGVRLAKGNDPEHMLDLLEDHIRAQGFHVVHEEPDLATRRAHDRVAKVERQGGYRAVRTGTGNPLVNGVVAALRASDPKLVINPTMGGSLPLYLFEDRSKAPIVILPIANYDNNQHAPNENLRIGQLWYGMEAYALILSR